MGETGYQADASLRSWASIANEAHETNPDLVWPASIDVFDKMRREDSQVGSVLRAVCTPILSTGWWIAAGGARPEVVENVARNMDLPLEGEDRVPPHRSGGRFSWAEHLRVALVGKLVFGHAYFEQVYEPEDAGELHRLRKLAYRPPRTIDRIEVASDGGLVAIVQSPIGPGKAPRIPVDRLVAYIGEREGANWLGVSVLRSAYKNWLLKDRLLRAQALTVDRNGLGVPVYTGSETPEGASVEERKAWEAAERQSGLDVARAFRAGETSGASIPYGAKLELKGVDGDLPDTAAPIEYHDQQIARAALAHFLNLGTQTGSWALGSTFADFFSQSLNGEADGVRAVLQQHVVEDLVDTNFGAGEPAPQIQFRRIGEHDQATAEAVKILIDCGAITRDAGLEKFMRGRYGLPQLPETGGYL